MKRMACDEMQLSKRRSAGFGAPIRMSVPGNDAMREGLMEKAHQSSKLAQENELLTRTGPGTPGGELLRRYWQPIMLLKDFAPGSPPLAVRVMSEDLVLFRDDAGRPGLLGLKCPHRCADLSYGRVEDGGLRCVYHGWLFDIDGNCLEQPGEPQGGVHRELYKHLSYPCLERAGAVWAYMGPGTPPLFPSYPALSAPDAYRSNARWYSECNYLQGNEGNVDPIHTSYLHRYAAEDVDAYSRTSQRVFGVDTAPKLSVRETRFGVRIFTDRKVGDTGTKILRLTNFVMPNACAIGGFEASLGRGGTSMFWHVPIDDTHHWRMEFTFHSKKALPREIMSQIYSAEQLPGGYSRRNAQNRYLQNRDEMNRSYLGMGRNFPTHDLFVTESQGPILDRTKEHLVSSDIAIVRTRRLMLAAIRDIAAGKEPIGVIRNVADNDFRDLLVLTETLDAGVDNEAFCAQLEAEDIYRLNQEIAAGTQASTESR
jgi:phthalate 4,5-dioxygenase oxygenase subunit